MSDNFFVKMEFDVSLSIESVNKITQRLMHAVHDLHLATGYGESGIHKLLSIIEPRVAEPREIRECVLDDFQAEFGAPRQWATFPRIFEFPYSVWSPCEVDLGISSFSPNTNMVANFELLPHFPWAMESLEDYPEYSLPKEPHPVMPRSLLFLLDTDFERLIYTRLMQILNFCTLRHCDEHWAFNREALCYVIASVVSLFPIRRVMSRHPSDMPGNQDIDYHIELYPRFEGPSLHLLTHVP
jgi:hypothetical protein